MFDRIEEDCSDYEEIPTQTDASADVVYVLYKIYYVLLHPEQDVFRCSPYLCVSMDGN